MLANGSASFPLPGETSEARTAQDQAGACWHSDRNPTELMGEAGSAAGSPSPQPWAGDHSRFLAEAPAVIGAEIEVHEFAPRLARRFRIGKTLCLSSDDGERAVFGIGPMPPLALPITQGDGLRNPMPIQLPTGFGEAST
jgi:hypothetical protein